MVCPLFASRANLNGNPLSHFVDQDDEYLALERLRIEQFVVAQWNRILGQHRHSIAIEWNLYPRRLDNFDQAIDVVDRAVASPVRRGDRLEPLLGLLCVKADDAVGDLPATRKLTDSGGSSSAFLRRIREVAERSGSGEDTAFAEGAVKKAPRNSAPFVRLASPIDHEVDGHFEPSQLFAEPAVLLAAPSKVRLYDEQIQITIRPSLPASTRAEQDDVGTGRRRVQTTSCLLDQSLLGHSHGR